MNNNNLIAEFMGHEVLYRPNSNGFIELSDTELCDVDDLEYHKSWDWLMPVVDKCLSQSDDTMLGVWSRVHESLATCNINAVYYAVVNFITYNKYPFEEGDEYWTLEDGDLVWSIWDDASEDMHDENPERKYYTENEVLELAKTHGIKYKGQYK